MPWPGGRKQLTAAFLSIERRKGTAAAKRFYRKEQRLGYAPIEKRDQKRVRVDHRAAALRKRHARR